MEYPPEKVAIVGAGYIAVELASVLQHLGSDVTLFVRGQGVLRVVRQHGARLHQQDFGQGRYKFGSE